MSRTADPNLQDHNAVPSSAARSRERSFQPEDAVYADPELREVQRDLPQSPGAEYREKAESITAWVNSRIGAHNLEPRYAKPQVTSHESGIVTKDQARPRHERAVGEAQ